MEIEQQKNQPEALTINDIEQRTLEVDEDLSTKQPTNVPKSDQVGPIKNQELGDLSSGLSEASLSYKTTLTSRDAVNIERIQKYLRCQIIINVGSAVLRTIPLFYTRSLQKFAIEAILVFWMSYIAFICSKALKRGLSSKKDFEEYEKAIKKANYLARFMFYFGIFAILSLIVFLIMFQMKAMNGDRNAKQVFFMTIGPLLIGILWIFFLSILLTILPYGLLYCRVGTVLMALNQLRDKFYEKIELGGLDASLGGE